MFYSKDTLICREFVLFIRVFVSQFPITTSRVFILVTNSISAFEDYGEINLIIYNAVISFIIVNCRTWMRICIS